MSINRVNITGNLTRDAELRQSQGPILKFTVAVNDRQRNRETGEWEDHANFVNCVLFGKRAESLASKLTKGLKVAVEGRLHYSSWDGKDGSKRSALEVYVDDLEYFTAPKSDELYSEDIPF